MTDTTPSTIKSADSLSTKVIEKALQLIEDERAGLSARQAEHAEQEKRLAFDARLGGTEASKMRRSGSEYRRRISQGPEFPGKKIQIN